MLLHLIAVHRFENTIQFQSLNSRIETNFFRHTKYYNMEIIDCFQLKNVHINLFFKNRHFETLQFNIYAKLIQDT